MSHANKTNKTSHTQPSPDVHTRVSLMPTWVPVRGDMSSSGRATTYEPSSQGWVRGIKTPFQRHQTNKPKLAYHIQHSVRTSTKPCVPDALYEPQAPIARRSSGRATMCTYIYKMKGQNGHQTSQTYFSYSAVR